MKFIKKNKFTLIALFCLLIVVIILVQIKNIFFPDMGRAIYGNRLEGIEDVKITKSELSTLADTLKERDYVKKVTSRVSGKIVECIVTVKEDANLDQSKELASAFYGEFSKDEKKFYDFQIFVKKTKKTDDFPIIGYKHHNKDSFSWTKDRTVSE